MIVYVENVIVKLTVIFKIIQEIVSKNVLINLAIKVLIYVKKKIIYVINIVNLKF